VSSLSPIVGVAVRVWPSLAVPVIETDRVELSRIALLMRSVADTEPSSA
jgi:hypothetical protein